MPTLSSIFTQHKNHTSNFALIPLFHTEANKSFPHLCCKIEDSNKKPKLILTATQKETPHLSRENLIVRKETRFRLPNCSHYKQDQRDMRFA